MNGALIWVMKTQITRALIEEIKHRERLLGDWNSLTRDDQRILDAYAQGHKSIDLNEFDSEILAY